MKRLTLIFILALSICLGGCQNNGDIGDWFGSWRVDSYMLNGLEQEGLAKATTFGFQSEVVVVTVVIDDYQTEYQRYGTWQELDDTFTLHFNHQDATTNPATDIYAAPEWLGMYSDKPMIMTLQRHDSRNVTLTWLGPDGATRTYKLHKIW